PWDQALDIVLRSLRLGMEKEGNIIRIATLAELRQEEQQRQQLLQARLLAQPQKIRLIPVNYAVASQMAAQVRNVLSPRGTISVDARTNVLIVKDFVPFLLRAEGIVRRLDTQTPQVLIEARIVEANVNFSRQFGIQWGGSLLFSPALGNGTGLQFPNPIGIRGGIPDQASGADNSFGVPNYVVNFPAASGRGNGTALSFFFGSLGGAFDLNLRLSAAESQGEVKVISSPKIVTLHRMGANIQQGLQIPYTSASAAGTNVQFVQANLALDVTPQVTTDGSVFLDLNVSNNAPDTSRGAQGGQIAISTKTARTRMLIKDGATMVIGGIYSRRTGTAEERVPFLGSIPILGALFRSHLFQDDRAELLIFITPRIINRAKTLGGQRGQ
ncbi:MAG: type IV pilus secretin PilQ, partial [Myxococcota bacterium]